MSETYLDANGVEIREGDRVIADPEMPGGTITTITEPDGDMDDDGRIYGIGPYVYVRWDDDDGEPEKFLACSTARGPWDDATVYQCDDIERAA